MTKRDVAVWFCKVWALAGMLGSAFSWIGYLMSWGASFLLSAPPFRGGTFVYSFPHLALSGFLWFFAASIGTELAAEGDYGPTITSATELKPLLLRCVGLVLLLSATSSLAGTLFQIGAFYFSAPNLGRGTFMGAFIGNAINYALQSIAGFLLAFTPRMRVFLGK